MNDFTWGMLFSKTKEYFNQICEFVLQFYNFKRGVFTFECFSKFLMFDLCVEPFKPTCFSEEPARGRYETAVSIMEFVCRGGYQGKIEKTSFRSKIIKLGIIEMSKSFECFSRTLTRAEMMQCQAEMLSDTNKISNKIPISGQAQNEAVCGYIY